MKPRAASFKILIALLGAVPFVGFAQNPVMTPADFGPVAGEKELIVGASAGSSGDLDDSFGGANASLSVFLSNTLSLGLRQTVNYVNPDSGGTAWNGSTRVALDQHFGTGPLRPFVGVNLGRVYGDSVRDTWAAGLEAGAKFYVKPKTFIFGVAEYGWFFERAHSLDDRFNDGQFLFSAGIGFNF